MEIPDSHKKEKRNGMHPPPRIFQGFWENPPPRKYQLVVFVLFPRVFFGRLFCSRPKAVLTMTQNIIQEQKDEARRIVEEQVACYIGCLDEEKEAASLPFPPVLLVGTWGNSSCFFAKVEEMHNPPDVLRVCFFLCSLFCTFIVVKC